jgi:hypothetical protein
MRSNVYVLAVAAVAVGLAASACGSSKTTEATTSAATPAATTTETGTTAGGGGTALQSLVPTPANSKQTYGPDPIAGNGIHLKFVVDSSPADVMKAYRAALQSQGWDVTTIVSSAGGGNGGGGATYTGTHGDAYGVFDGGGFGATTYVNVCAWPSKPADPNCSRTG